MSEGESSDDSEIQDTVVIDNGSSFTAITCGMKVGWAGDDAPTDCFPTVIGRRQYHDEHVLPGGNSRDYYIGDHAISNISMLTLTRPIQHGIVTNLFDMEQIWQYAFRNCLRIGGDEKDKICIMTERILNPTSNREKMMKSMFETFEFKGFYIDYKEILSSYASGRTTSTVLQIGDGVTTSVSIYEGYLIPHATQRLDFGGHHLNEYLMKLLSENHSNIDFGTNYTKIIADIKEKLCYVAADYNTEVPDVMSYELPDGQSISIQKERCKVSELLFEKGVHELAYKSIMKCDINMRRDILNRHIVLSGGTTFMNGFPERLEHEMNELHQNKCQIKLCAPPERKYSSWIGGSIVGSLTSFEPWIITKQEYNESGSSILYRKAHMHTMSWSSDHQKSNDLIYTNYVSIAKHKEEEILFLIEGYIRQHNATNVERFDEEIKECIGVYMDRQSICDNKELMMVRKQNDRVNMLLNDSQNKLKNVKLELHRLQDQHSKTVDLVRKSMEYAELKQKYKEENKLNDTIVELEKKNALLMDEYNETFAKYKTLKMSSNRRTSTVDESKYMEWSQDDVLCWILSLDDSKFLQYDNLLTRVIAEQELDGSCLVNVDLLDIEQWGIGDPDDCHCLFQHVQHLCSYI
eukprot:700340_1